MTSRPTSNKDNRTAKHDQNPAQGRDQGQDQVQDQEQRLLTITEAAEILSSPVATLRYWRHLNTGPHSFRLGRRVIYRYSDLITWINAQHDEDPHAADPLNRVGSST